jgi:hypothetical protein
MFAKRLAIYLFVLMQGIAPLLHAHTGKAWHLGLHLPQFNQSGDARTAVPGARASDAGQYGQSIGLPSSLEGRQAQQSTGNPTPPVTPWRVPGATHDIAYRDLIPAFPPEPARHLRPPANAPPSA